MLPTSTRLFHSNTRGLSAASKARKAIPLYMRPRNKLGSTSSTSQSPTSTSSTSNLNQSASPLTGTTNAIDANGLPVVCKVEKGKKMREGIEALRVNDWAEPPLVAQARAKTVKQRNVWESYLVLPPKTRLYISLGLFAFALVGLYGSDYLVPETEEEKKLKRAQLEKAQQRANAQAA